VTNLNPGLAKGYALDFGSPVQYVAEGLREGPRTLEELVEGYSHDPAELSRVWDQELRRPRERRRLKGGQEEREAQAKTWLLQRALEALDSQVQRENEHYSLTVGFDDLRVGGLPLPGSETFVEASAREAARPRASTRARRSPRAKTEPSSPASAASDGARASQTHTQDAAASEHPEPEPEPASEVREWLRAHRYTAARLAKALEMDRAEVERLLDGAQEAPRVVRLALWALEHGADGRP